MCQKNNFLERCVIWCFVSWALSIQSEYQGVAHCVPQNLSPLNFGGQSGKPPPRRKFTQGGTMQYDKAALQRVESGALSSGELGFEFRFYRYLDL